MAENIVIADDNELPPPANNKVVLAADDELPPPVGEKKKPSPNGGTPLQPGTKGTSLSKSTSQSVSVNPKNNPIPLTKSGSISGVPDFSGIVKDAVAPKVNPSNKALPGIGKSLISEAPDLSNTKLSSDNLIPKPSAVAQAQIDGAKSREELDADKNSLQLADYLEKSGKSLKDFDPVDFKKHINTINGETEETPFIGKAMAAYKSDLDAYGKAGAIINRNIDVAKADIDSKLGPGTFGKYQKLMQDYQSQFKFKEPLIKKIDGDISTITQQLTDLQQKAKSAKNPVEYGKIKQQYGALYSQAEQLQKQRDEATGPLAQMEQELKQLSSTPEFQKLNDLYSAQQTLSEKQESLLDKHPDAKQTLQRWEDVQKFTDGIIRQQKLVNPAGAMALTLGGDVLKTITKTAKNLSAIPSIVEKATGTEGVVERSPLKLIDVAFDAINDVSSAADNEVNNLTPSNMDLPVSQHYKIVDGNKIFVDKNGNALFARDIDGYKLGDSAEKKAIEKYNATPEAKSQPTVDKVDAGVLINEAVKFGLDIAGPLKGIGTGLTELGLAGSAAKGYANGTLTLMGYGLNDAYESAKQSAPNLTDQQASQYALGSQAAIGLMFSMLGGAKMKYITGDGENIFAKIRSAISKEKGLKLDANDIKAIDGGLSPYQVGQRKVLALMKESLLQGGEMGVIMPTANALMNGVTNKLVGYKALGTDIDLKESFVNGGAPAMLVGAVTGFSGINRSSIKNEAWSKITKDDASVKATIDFINKSTEDGLYTTEQADKLKQRIAYTAKNLEPFVGTVDDAGRKVLANLYDHKFQLTEKANSLTDDAAKKAMEEQIKLVDNDITETIKGNSDNLKSQIAIGIRDGNEINSDFENKNTIDKSIALLPKPQIKKLGLIEKGLDKVFGRIGSDASLSEMTDSSNKSEQAKYDSRVEFIKNNKEFADYYSAANSSQREHLENMIDYYVKNKEEYNPNDVHNYDFVRSNGDISFTGKGLSAQVEDFKNVPRDKDGYIDWDKAKVSIISHDGKVIKSGIKSEDVGKVLREENDKYNIEKTADAEQIKNETNSDVVAEQELNNSSGVPEGNGDSGEVQQGSGETAMPDKAETPKEESNTVEWSGDEVKPTTEVNQPVSKVADNTEQQGVKEAVQPSADGTGQGNAEGKPADVESEKRFTESKDMNRMFAELKSKHGDKKGTAIYQAADRLVNPNTNTIVEIRSNGVVVKEGDKYIMKPFGNTDANSKNWTLYKGIDVTDQYAPKDQPVSKTETTENPALKDVESTAKALDGVGKEDLKGIYKAIPDDYELNIGEEGGVNKSISEAYHKAKEDGTNPELVKAVEDLLGKAPTQYTEASGVSGSALKDVGDTFENREAIEDNLKDLGDDVYYHGSDDISYLSSKEDFNTVSNTKNAESKYVNLTPKAGTAVSYSIRQQRIGAKSGVAAFKLKGKGYTMTNADIKTLKSNADYEAFYDKKKSEGYDFVKVPQDANDIVVLNNNAIEYVGKKFNKDALTKAPTQYTEAATPKEEVEGVSGSALKDVESTAKALEGVKFNANFNLPLEQTKSPKQVSEAYHKAKADGSNPELVKAVEEALTPQTENTKTNEEQSTNADITGKTTDAEPVITTDETSQKSEETKSTEESGEGQREKGEDVGGAGEEKGDVLTGIKKAENDKLRESLGLPKVELPKGVSRVEGMIQAKDLVDSGEVNPLDIENKAISFKDEPHKLQASTQDNNVLNYRRYQLVQKKAELLKQKAVLESGDMDKPETIQELAVVQQRIIDNLHEIDRNSLASDVVGKVFAGSGNARQVLLNSMGQVERAIERIKATYADEVPEDVKAKLEELQAKADDAHAKLSALEEKLDTTRQEFDEEVKKAYERGKKEGTIKPTKTYTAKAKDAADTIRKLKSKPITLRDADGNEITLTQNNILPWNEMVELAATAVEKAGEAADRVSLAIDAAMGRLKDEEWYMNLSPKNRKAIEEQVGQQLDDLLNPKEKASKLSIPHARIKEAMKSGIDNIKDLVEEINKDYPDATPREVRDAITGYGTTKELNKDPENVALRRMKRIGRYISMLEDIENGERPSRSGLQRDVPDPDERKMMKEVREKLKKLKPTDEDISKKLKTAQDIIEARLQNEIDDIQREIDTGERAIKTKRDIPTTEKMDELRALKAQKIAERDAKFATDKREDALQEIRDAAAEEDTKTITVSMVKNNLIGDLVSAHITEGEPTESLYDSAFKKVKEILPDVTEREFREAFLKKGKFAPQQKTKTQLQKELADIKSQQSLIKRIDDLNNGIVTETKKQGEKSEAVKKLQKELADIKSQQSLIKRIDDLNNGIVTETKKQGEKSEAVKKLQKELADIKSQQSLIKRIDDLNNGIVTETKKQGEKSEAVKKLQKELADIKSQQSLIKRIDDLNNGIVTETKKQGEKSEAVRKLQKELADIRKKANNQFAELSADELRKKAEAVQRQIDKGEFIKPEVVKNKFESNPEWIKRNRELVNIKMELKKLETDAYESNKSTFMKLCDIFNNWTTRALFLGTYAYQVKLGVAAGMSVFSRPFEELAGGIYNTAFKGISKNAPIEGNTMQSIKTLPDFYIRAIPFLNPIETWNSTKEILKTGQSELDKEFDPFHKENFSFKGKSVKEVMKSFASADHIAIIDALTTDPHMIMKDPIKRGAYEASYKNYMQWVADNMGTEYVNDPMVIETAKNASYLRAKSEIFMGGKVTEGGSKEAKGWNDKIKGYFTALQMNAIRKAKSDSVTERMSANKDYALSTMWNFLVPIKKVPLNILSRVVKGNPIVLVKNILGAIKTNYEVNNKGLQLTTEESDAILRDLKKGTTGSVWWILGYLAAGSMVGGFYNPFDPDKKRKKDEAKSGEILLGQKEDSWQNLVIHGGEHSSQIASLMLGATFHNTLRHYMEDEKEAFFYAMTMASVATTRATIDQNPLVGLGFDAADAFKSERGAQKFGENIKGRFDIPKKIETINPVTYWSNKLHSHGNKNKGKGQR